MKDSQSMSSLEVGRDPGRRMEGGMMVQAGLV